MKELAQLIENVKFKLEYIYIIGFDSFGHRIKACVCYVPEYQVSDGKDVEIITRYAYVKSDNNVIFLQETVMENRFEIIFNPPLLLFYGVKEQYINKLENLEKEKSAYILGKKVSTLRKQYTYNPLLDKKEKYPWWYTLDHLDKEYELNGIALDEDELPPQDRPKLKKVYAAPLREIKKQKHKPMSVKIDSENIDELLLIDANDAEQRKYQQ